VPLTRNIGLTTRQLAGRAQFFSEVGQDLWLTETVYPGKTQGFFLDVGSGHGTIGSNTKLIESKGWTGVCIDPFPKHMEGRTCQMLREVVFDKAGEKVQFAQADDLGGINQTLGAWKERASQAPMVEFTTVTLADILERTHAPKVIDFMSLDIEGAELAALKGFPFDKYEIGALAVEHNYEEPKRSDIQKFLADHGMQRVGSIKQDDLYVRRAGK
jgi:FkbM family methyltransferase